MNKKLIAAAVAGLFAAPTAALAQSSVTISGQIKGGFESLKLSNQVTSRGNNSQTGVVDDSSALVFSVREDLGGGMAAIVRLDMRIKPDDGGGSASVGASSGLVSAVAGESMRSSCCGSVAVVTSGLVSAVAGGSMRSSGWLSSPWPEA